MIHLIVDAIGGVSALILVWYLIRVFTRMDQKKGQADAMIMEDNLQKITQITGLSAYDIFRIAAEEWHVAAGRIDKDFKKYLSSLSVPYYVKDFVRKSQPHIDELYQDKSSYITDKRLLLFYSFLVLLFWGGAVFLSLYIFPIILPEGVRAL